MAPLTISKIYGISSHTKPCFTISNDKIAYVASGGAVVSKLKGREVVQQRFFCAGNQHPSQSPRINDRDSYGITKPENSIIISHDNDEEDTYQLKNSDLSPVKTAGSKLAMRIKSISSIALSCDGKFLIVGETGHQPRILVFSTAIDSNDYPVFCIQHHSYGVANLKFHPSEPRVFVSLGQVNDGFIHFWKITNTSVVLLGSNKCSSTITDIIWPTSSIMFTYGLRHIKLWNVPELTSTRSQLVQGKNIVLGKFLRRNFVDASVLNSNQILFLTDENEILLCEGGSLVSYYELVEEIEGKVSNICIDIENDCIWTTAGNEVNHIDLSCVIDGPPVEKLMRAEDEPQVKKHTTEEICSLLRFSSDSLLYLRSHEEVCYFDTVKHTSSALIRGVLPAVNGMKLTFRDDILLWSPEGQVKLLNSETMIETALISKNLFQLGIFLVDTYIGNQVTSVEIVGSNIVLGDRLGFLVMLDPELKKVWEVKAHSSSINDIRYIPEQEVLVSVARDRMIQVFQQVEGKMELFETLDDHKANVNCVVVSRDHIITASNDRMISVYRLEKSPELKIYKEKFLTIKASPIAMLLNDTQLIVTTNDKTNVVFNRSSWEQSKTFKLVDENNDAITVDNMILDAGNLICTSPTDKILRVYNYQNSRLVDSNYGHSENILSLLQAKDKIITVSNNGCLFVWEWKTFVPPVIERPDAAMETSPVISTPVLRKIRKPPTMPAAASENSLSPRPRSPIRPQLPRPAPKPISPTKVSVITPTSSPTVRPINRIPLGRSPSPQKKSGIIPASSLGKSSVFQADKLVSDLKYVQANHTTFDTATVEKIKNEVIKLNAIFGITCDAPSAPVDLLEKYSDELVALVREKL